MASAKASLKGERISGQEAKKAGEEWAQRAGSKIDSTVRHPLPFSFASLNLGLLFQINDARAKMHEADKTIAAKASQAESKLDQLKYDSAAQYDKSKQEAKQSIDKFDKTVEKKTAEAKSGISSWFGFGGK